MNRRVELWVDLAFGALCLWLAVDSFMRGFWLAGALALAIVFSTIFWYRSRRSDSASPPSETGEA